MATYRYGVVRSRIAASQLVAGAGQRFESARRLSIFGLSKVSSRCRHRGSGPVGDRRSNPYSPSGL
jgi:hypothetical protein